MRITILDNHISADVRFWADAIYRRGAGPSPISPKDFNKETVSEAFHFALQPNIRKRAAEMGDAIRSEQGESKGVESFYRHLPLLNMRYAPLSLVSVPSVDGVFAIATWSCRSCAHVRCDLDRRRLALWWHSKSMTKLSGAAAAHLASLGKIAMADLVPHRSREYDTTLSNTEPVLGTAQGLLSLVTFSATSFKQLFTRPVSYSIPDHHRHTLTLIQEKGVVNTFYGVPKGMSTDH